MKIWKPTEQPQGSGGTKFPTGSLGASLRQARSASRIQSVITEDELEGWYEKALRGKSSDIIADKILQRLANEIKLEFPSTTSEFADFFKSRRYASPAADDFLDA